jgi:hypothetical protein
MRDAHEPTSPHSPRVERSLAGSHSSASLPGSFRVGVKIAGPSPAPTDATLVADVDKGAGRRPQRVRLGKKNKRFLPKGLDR